MTEQKHTATPYNCATGPSMHGWPIINYEGRMIASLPMLPEGFPNKEELDRRILATGKFIKRACNIHYDLVDAGKEFISAWTTGDGHSATIERLQHAFERMQVALAKAHGDTA